MTIVSESLFKRRDRGEELAHVSILVDEGGPDHKDIPGFTVREVTDNSPLRYLNVRGGQLRLEFLEQIANMKGVSIIRDPNDPHTGAVRDFQ